MSRKKTTEEFIIQAKEIHGDRFDYSKVNYINSKIDIIIVCKIHGDFLKNPGHHLHGQGCPNCSKENKIKLLSKDISKFIEQAQIIHNNTYDYSDVIYVNDKTNVKIICMIHGAFSQMPNAHLRGQGCPDCGRAKQIVAQTRTISEFIKEANLIHNHRYDYTKVNYINGTTYVNIICSVHGSFSQTPANHLIGKGCKKCANDLLRKSAQEFIDTANTIHHNKYDYTYIIYINSFTKVKIICPKHGEFYQSPDSHIRSKGCYQCGREACGNSTINDTQYFIEQSNIIHNNKYDYSKTNYINNRSYVIIICPLHGEFSQLAGGHLSGRGCKKCISAISKPETAWLDTLNILPENRNINLAGLGQKDVDGFDPKTNTAYEFHGDFWHGNLKIFDPNAVNPVSKKTFIELYEYTIEKEKLIRDAGYNLIVMWENDWKQLKKEHE